MICKDAERGRRRAKGTEEEKGKKMKHGGDTDSEREIKKKTLL